MTRSTLSPLALTDRLTWEERRMISRRIWLVVVALFACSLASAESFAQDYPSGLASRKTERCASPQPLAGAVTVVTCQVLDAGQYSMDSFWANGVDKL